MNRRVRVIDRRRLLAEDSPDGWRSRSDNTWVKLCCFFVLFVVPLVVCNFFLTAYVLYIRSPDGGSITELDTIPELKITPASIPNLRQPPSVLIPEAPSEVAVPVLMNTTHRPAYRPPPSLTERPNVCSSILCRFAAQYYRAKLDESLDPCKDFYKYVCSTFKGANNQYRLTELDMEYTTTSIVRILNIPPNHQKSYEKAAALFQTCVLFVKNKKAETNHLAKWIESLGVDLYDPEALKKNNPVKLIVRCSFEIGVPVILEFVVSKRIITNKKKLLEVRLNKHEQQFIEARDKAGVDASINRYSLLLSWYGIVLFRSTILNKIYRYETILSNMIQSRYYLIDTPAPYEPIRVMGNETSPFVTSEEWVTYIAEYTNKIYGSEDRIIMRPPALRILADMLEEKIFGREGLNYLIAWSLYTQLVFHTQPAHFPGRKDVLRGCYDHVAKVMKLALVSPYLHAIVTPDLFEHGKKLVAKLVETFRATLASSKWLNGTAREVALRKIDKMKLHIGSPGNRLDPAMVEKFYEPLPDVPVPPKKGATNLFSSWIKARSLSARALWLDQATFLFDEGDVNAFHLTYYNAIIIPAAILTRPFLISTLTDPLNYGALGSTLGHEIMHGFDVSGTEVNDENIPMRWSTSEFLEEYTKRALCLRQAHKSVVKATARQEVVNDTLDSENLADFIGVRVAHAALQSLPQPQRSMTLAGLNVTSERLFFINYCTQRCSEGFEPDDRYAPARSRCIVPLMNMPEFSSAFGCAAGEPMNPPDKCTFW